MDQGRVTYYMDMLLYASFYHLNLLNWNYQRKYDLLLQSYQATKRAGWVKRGVQEPESIADHMYRMGLMALIASDNPSVNREK